MAIARHKSRQRELREGRALARRVQRGDREAFALLYASYEGRLYRFCQRLTGSDAAAAGLVEAAFACALETLDVSRTVIENMRSAAEAIASERLSSLTSMPPQLNKIENVPIPRSWKSHRRSAIWLNRRCASAPCGPGQSIRNSSSPLWQPKSPSCSKPEMKRLVERIRFSLRGALPSFSLMPMLTANPVNDFLLSSSRESAD